MHKLEGTWQPLYAALEGEEAPTEVLQRTELELADGVYTVRFGGVAADQGTYSTDAAAPNHVTLQGTAGPNAGRTIPCLFKFVDDTLIISYGLAGVRPLNFKTAPDTRIYLVTYCRK
jgi:uncharacterized protein (TIGR03067 family)